MPSKSSSDEKLIEKTEKRLAGEKPRERLSGADDETAAPITTEEDGKLSDYYVLPAEDRKRGFVRPVRSSYVHEKCQSSTRMGIALAETYAADPTYYGATYCTTCKGHFPVGKDGEFVWQGTTEKVGT